LNTKRCTGNAVARQFFYWNLCRAVSLRTDAGAIGRKKPLYVGLVIYLFASIGCAFTESVNSLIAFRFLQALGSCAGMVTARAIVRDLFEVKDNAKVFFLDVVVAVSPIIAPTVGGYVTSALGWRYVFAALIAVDIAIIIGVIFLLPESKKPTPIIH